MIILDSTTKSLEIVLSGTVTNELPIVASYVDLTLTTYTPISSDTQTNGTTPVTIVSPPAASTQRQIKFLSVNNADTSSATVTIQYNDNGTIRIIVKFTLDVDDTLLYTDGEGFRVLDSTGKLKVEIGAFSGHSGYSGFSGGTGSDGASGPSGYSGFSGPSGYSGFSGGSGYSGFSGAGGSIGLSGLSGYSGFSGLSGYSGFSGLSGYSGFSGRSGYSGFSGLSGYSGFSGPSGYSGFSGESAQQSGYSGFSGRSGYSGFSGPSGYSGFSGGTGSNGTSGFSGYSGGTGSDGTSGFSGFSGRSGYSGFSGLSGYSGFSGVGAVAATQAEQEAASSTTVFTSPGRQQFHPSACKFWAQVTGAGTPVLTSNYNVASIADTGTGRMTITIGTDFSSASWCHVNSGMSTGSTVTLSTHQWGVSKAAGTIEIDNCDASATPVVEDPSVGYDVAGFGDQA